MNLEIPVPQLKTALTGLGKVALRHPSIPALGCLLLKADQGQATLTATDLDTFATARLEAAYGGESVLVPMDPLRQAVKRASPDAVLELAFSDTQMVLRSPVAGTVVESRLEALPVADFPSQPEIGGKTLPVDDNLARAMAEAMSCASEDASRLILLAHGATPI